MLTLYEMNQRGDVENVQTADLLLRSIFAEREMLDLLYELFRAYESWLAPKEYLVHVYYTNSSSYTPHVSIVFILYNPRYLTHLIETAHYTLHLLKHFGERHTNFVMLDRARRVRKPKRNLVLCMIFCC